MLNRRALLTGLLAAPLVVPASNLMPLRGVPLVIRPRAVIELFDQAGLLLGVGGGQVLDSDRGVVIADTFGACVATGVVEYGVVRREDRRFGNLVGFRVEREAVVAGNNFDLSEFKVRIG